MGEEIEVQEEFNVDDRSRLLQETEEEGEERIEQETSLINGLAAENVGICNPIENLGVNSNEHQYGCGTSGAGRVISIGSNSPVEVEVEKGDDSVDLKLNGSHLATTEKKQQLKLNSVKKSAQSLLRDIALFLW